jgi:predicted peroxiredoxin
MSNKAAVSLTTGLEDAEKVTVALLVAVGAAESGRPTLMFLTKEGPCFTGCLHDFNTWCVIV